VFKTLNPRRNADSQAKVDVHELVSWLKQSEQRLPPSPLASQKRTTHIDDDNNDENNDTLNDDNRSTTNANENVRSKRSSRSRSRGRSSRSHRRRQSKSSSNHQKLVRQYKLQLPSLQALAYGMSTEKNSKTADFFCNGFFFLKI
jgi:hypothetical protein